MDDMVQQFDELCASHKALEIQIDSQYSMITTQIQNTEKTNAKLEQEFHNFSYDTEQAIANFDSISSTDLHEHSQCLNHLKNELTNTQINTKKRITNIKATTTEFFKHHDDDLEILNDRVHRLEEGLAQMKRHTRSTRTPLTKKLRFDTSSDDSDDIPQHNHSPSPPHIQSSSFTSHNTTPISHTHPSAPYQPPGKFRSSLE